MMNRNELTASTLDETALDAYYTLTEGGANYGIGLALAATLNSFKNRNTSSPVRIDEDTMDAYLAVNKTFFNSAWGCIMFFNARTRAFTQPDYFSSKTYIKYFTPNSRPSPTVSLRFCLKFKKLYYFFALGRLAPYLERRCVRFATPAVSSVPRTM